MDNKIKEITKVGNSACVILDKEILYKAELKVGDKMEITCNKGKVTIKKQKEEK